MGFKHVLKDCRMVRVSYRESDEVVMCQMTWTRWGWRNEGGRWFHKYKVMHAEKSGWWFVIRKIWMV